MNQKGMEIHMPEAKMQPTLTPRIEGRNAILIAGLQRHYTSENLDEIPAQWRNLPFGKIPDLVGRAAYGVVFNGEENVCDFDYLTGPEVSGFSRLPDEFARMSIPAQRYAIFPHRDHVSKLKNTIDTIVKTWMPTATAILAAPCRDEAWMIEYYGEDFDPQTGMGTMEVWFPVKG
jgi:AraC family transcriptional regulator